MSAAEASGYIAVTEHVTESGLVVWWRLSSTIQWQALHDAWVGAGLSEEQLPSQVTAARALGRVMQEQKEARRLVRPLPGHKGYAIVDESAKSDDLKYEVVCKVHLGETTQTPIVEPMSHACAGPIIMGFYKHKDALSQTDISEWLTDRARALGAVSLRDTGGIYFIPRDSVAAWRKLKDVVKSVSAHFIAGLPAMSGPDAVEAIMDSLVQECATEAEKLEAELAGGDLGAVSLKNRIERVAQIEQKMSRYKAIFGVQKDSLDERLETLRADLAVASMATT